MAERVYCGSSDSGIYHAVFDPSKRTLSKAERVSDLISPTFLAMHPTKPVIYAEIEAAGRIDPGLCGVAVLAMDPKTGSLTLINRQPDAGAGVCHIFADRPGKNLLTADYPSGIFSVIRIEPDASLGKVISRFQSRGRGPDAARQSSPHAHQICLDPAEKFAFLVDLGVDKIWVLAFDPETGSLTPADPLSVNLSPGAGPRHLAFHRGAKFAYVINELNSTVTAFQYYPEHGNLKEIQTISSVPENFGGKSFASEIAVHPSGRFLYASNRGYDSIVRFEIDPFHGRLSGPFLTRTDGKCPRHFAIDPSGGFLLVGNQNSNSVTVMAIDPQTGDSQPIQTVSDLPSPACLLFAGPIG